MALLGSEVLRIDNHLIPVFEKLQWPVVGSLDYMRQWNFDQGMTSLQARTYRYGHQPEAVPLSPKSRLVHIALEEPVATPTTILSRKPMYDNAELQYRNEKSDDFDLGESHSFGIVSFSTLLGHYLSG